MKRAALFLIVAFVAGMPLMAPLPPCFFSPLFLLSDLSAVGSPIAMISTSANRPGRNSACTWESCSGGSGSFAFWRSSSVYGELVRPGGIIALHDIQRSDLFPDQQSDVYWQELKAKVRTREFIAEPTPGAGMGIGVIFVDESGNTRGCASSPVRTSSATGSATSAGQ